MKVVGVLAFVAVFITQGAETLKCQKTADYSVSVTLAEETCAGGETKCSRPVLATGAYVAGETWGCKDTCKVEGSESCVLCAEDNCNTEPTFQCFVGANVAATSKVCDDVKKTTMAEPQAKCKRPKLMYETLAAGDEFDCGDQCNTVSTCVTCDTADCNNPADIVNQNAGHMCFAYTWSTNKYVKADAKACIGNDDDTTQCNSPTVDVNVDANSVYNEGCGPCTTDAGVCTTCATSSCNDKRVCFTDEANNAANAKICATADDKCQRPMKDYGGLYTAGSWACGACTVDTKDKTCKECDGDECNTVVVGVTHECYAYTWSNGAFVKGALADCNRGESTKIECNMPTVGATVAQDNINEGGCGPCEASKDAVCTTCTSASCNSADNRVCFTDEDNTVSSHCGTGETICQRPMKDYGGYVTGSWACGACALNSKDKTCKECNDANKCNIKVAGETHKCYKYSWKTDKFVKGELADCNRGENPKIECNMPKEADAEDDYKTVDGCGPCASGEKCEACDKAECNSAAAKAAIALLFALVYTMI